MVTGGLQVVGGILLIPILFPPGELPATPGLPVKCSTGLPPLPFPAP